MIKFQTIGLLPGRYDFSKSNAVDNQKTRLNYASTDTFIKQQEDVSFGGFRKNKKVENRTEDNLASSLKHVSIKGTPFLLGLAASVAMVKMGKGAQELLCDEDGYKVNSNGVKSDLVNIDEKDGIIKFEGTGIEIDADKCDVADWENGVFRNYDGSIDIDLGNNKFIDTDNGIFVDPDANISAVIDGEHFENIAIPSFGSGYPTCPWDDRWGTMGNNNDDVEEKNVFEKAGDFIKSLFDKDSDVGFEGMKDIFGNEIIEATDMTGDKYLTYLPEKLANAPAFEEFRKFVGDDETAIEVANNLHLKSYLENNYPSFGTRVMAYEGGRNSWGGEMPGIEERYDSDLANEVLSKIANDGAYYPDPGSIEAINFAKYQNSMIKEGLWDKPMISYATLLDVNGDGNVDIDLDGDGIPDIDIDGDGIIEMSSEHHGAYLWETLKDCVRGIFGA